MDNTEQQRLIDKIQKLLRLAERGGTEAEAATAAAKVQELLTAYNLDMATVVQKGGDTGKREDARVGGGMYVYERELWQAVAELNFCMYFTTKKREVRRAEKRAPDGTLIRPEKKYWQHQHRIVGRTINVSTSRSMAEYLQQTAERLCRERLAGDQSQFFSRDAVAYREGIIDRVIEKLRERRRNMVDEETRKREKAEADARRAARAGVSTSTAMTIANVEEAEEAANYDFLHGEGAWARKQQSKAEWEANWEKRRAERAAAEAAAEAAYAAWAAANPEEAAKEEKKQRARKRAQERSWSRRSYRERAPTGKERRQSSGMYYAGYDKGDEISLDQQADHRERRRIA